MKMTDEILSSIQELLNSIILTETVDETDIKHALQLSGAMQTYLNFPVLYNSRSCGNCRFGDTLDIDESIMVCRYHCIETTKDKLCDNHEME